MRDTVATSSEHLDQEVVSIVRDGKNLAKRTQYMQRLQELGPTAIETLLALAREERQANKKLMHFSFILIGFAGLVLLLKFFQKKYHPSVELELLLLGLQFLFQISGMGLLIFQSSRIASVLAELDDIRIVGPLLEARFREAQPAGTEALMRLLPRMKASDAHLLNASQRKALYSLLDGKDDKLKITVLKALQQIGDGTAIPYVKRLATPTKGIFVAPPIQVQNAAAECLPYLYLRAEQERESMTLLRAAGTTETSSRQLLRPATATSDTDTTSLLRAIQGVQSE